MADVSKIEEIQQDADNAVTIPIFLNGEPLLSDIDGKQCTWSVLGQESKAWRDAERKWTRMQRTGAYDPDSEAKRMIFLVASVSTGWTGFEENKKPLAPTIENYSKWLKVRDVFYQVFNATAQHALFFKKGSAN